jgi:hypothetical protein
MNDPPFPLTAQYCVLPCATVIARIGVRGFDVRRGSSTV